MGVMGGQELSCEGRPSWVLLAGHEGGLREVCIAM